MISKHLPSLVPQFDRNLVAFVAKALDQVEGMEVEADPESTNCVVLLLPCAGIAVKILVSLQDVNFLDIGFPHRPEFSHFVVENHYENTIGSWNPANPDSLGIIIRRLKMALIDFFIEKVPRQVLDDITKGLPSCSLEVAGHENNPDQLFMTIRLRPSTEIIALATSEKSPDCEAAQSLCFLDCNFQLDIKSKVPTDLSLKLSFYLKNYFEIVNFDRRVNSIQNLVASLKKHCQTRLTKVTCDRTIKKLHRRRMTAALRTIFGNQLISFDRANFEKATLTIRTSEKKTLFMDIKFEEILNQSTHRIKIDVCRSESPDEVETFDLNNVENGMVFHKNQLEIAKLIATYTIPCLIAIDN